MTTIVQRRGMIRPITNLPASPGGAAVQEVEIAGAFYQAPAGGSGVGTWNLTQFQCPLSTDFSDQKGHTVTTTGTVAISGGKATFTGAGGRIAISPTTPTDLNVGYTFCFEGWFATSQAAQQYTMLIEHDNGASPNGSWACYINSATGADGKISFYVGGSGVACTTTHAWNDGNRHHLAVSRNGHQTLIYVDGVLEAAGATSGPASASIVNDVLLGDSTYATRHFIGTLDNWRMLDGAVLYTAKSFTVPTPPFPTS